MRTAPPRCRRPLCPNRLTSDDQIVCTGDFHLLAGVCRGKKRLGEPVAAMIESGTGGRLVKYSCALCLQFHTGGALADAAEQARSAAAIVQALLDDERVGRQGRLKLADAWAPENSARATWWEGLDQRAAYR